MLIEIKNQPKSIIKNIPSKPGTYRMLDSGEKVLYVGKAKNLKKRMKIRKSKNRYDKFNENFYQKVINHIIFQKLV